MDDQTSETTQLLRAWAGGDRDALERLTLHVYRTLRRIAGRYMRNEREGQTLQATALVHEAYLELIDITNVDWQHRAIFSLYRRRSCGIFCSTGRGGGWRRSEAATRSA
jgi:DNA-directed RNA polymerase specialized sigma24 family protein